MGLTGKILYCYWPIGIKSINPDGSDDRLIAELNFWHAASDLEGKLVVADTNWPDLGIQLVDVATGGIDKLCESDSSDPNKQVHPHPSLSPDGTKVIFGSSSTGSSEVYVADLSDM
jgi:oligogalacturonide lyase